MFNITSLTELLYPFEHCVPKLIEKGKRFEPSTSSDTIATFVYFLRDYSSNLFHWMDFLCQVYILSENHVRTASVFGKSSSGTLEPW